MKLIGLKRPTITQRDFFQVKAGLERMRDSKGGVVAEFEKSFRRFVGAKECFAVNSGTNALYLALKCLGLKRSDEVILPSYTCISLYYAIKHAGAVPVLVDNSFDVKCMDFNMSIDSIMEKLSSKTKAVIVPHMFGVCSQIEEIMKETGLPVIEDSAQAFGAVTAKGNKAGSVGDLAVFSFNGKMITTGEGGMVCVNNKDFVQKMVEVSGSDFETDLWALRTERDMRKIRRHFLPAPLNNSMSDLQAGLGIAQLGQLRGFIKKRKAIAKSYAEGLSLQGEAKPVVRSDSLNVFYRFIVSVGPDAGSVVAKLKRNAVDAGRGCYPPIHYFLGASAAFPMAEKCVGSLLSIPIYPKLSDPQIEYIIKICNRVIV